MANRILRTLASNYSTNQQALEWYAHKDYCTKIGIRQNIIQDIGKINFIEYTLNVGSTVGKGENIAFLENDKSLISIEAPFDCEVLDIPSNHNLLISNININPECRENSWVVNLSNITNNDILYQMAMI